MAQTFNLGKVVITPKGLYSSSATYEALDLVSYGGSSYLALRSVSGMIPSPTSTYYMQIASKGDKGDTGAQPTVSLGTVSTGAAGSSVIITNTGTPTNAVFNFTIPRGDKGEAGRATSVTTVTIPANSWSNKSATVNCTGMTADSLIIVAPHPETYQASVNSGVYCSGQGSGTLTFGCVNAQPTTAIKQNVMIFLEND